MFWLNLLFCRFSYFAVNISNQTTVYNLLICNVLNLKIPPPEKSGEGFILYVRALWRSKYCLLFRQR